ncbi:MAG: DNA-binding protein [Desulfobacteraceae bacterium]|nr:MAG: DNA-binding protein [Desulfobacteraceae bacterium]
MLTTPQAASALGVTRGRVLQMITRGQLPAVKVGRDWLIEENDLQRVVDRPGPGRPKKER